MTDKPAQHRGARKRDEILDAAARAFAADGFDNASMDRIAELAGASKRTVYNHFGSKEALFEAVVQHLLEQFHAIDRVIYRAHLPLTDQLAEFARAKVAVVEHPLWLRLLRVVLGVFIQNPTLARQTMQQAMSADNALVRWLDAARRDGRIHLNDPERAAQLYWAMVSGALFLPQLFEAPLPPDQRDAFIEEIVATFLARFAAQAT